MTHFNHPAELTATSAEAVTRLVDGGVPVWNQSVLLRDINDDAETIRALNRGLVRLRAVPYYLHQCDLAEGIEHFRTPLKRGLDIIEALRGHSSGLMVPQLCVDVPGGLGKVTLQPEWLIERSERRVVFRTYTGELGEYLEPPTDGVDTPQA
jgi:lysine 2,3-aminomutase